jgi:serine/threonine-protein phosphatase PGAM5
MRRLLLLCGVLLALVAASDQAQWSRGGRGIRYVYLIRHGAYTPEDDRDDREGNGLDSLGREQARWVGERLASLPVPIDTLVSSEFMRAQQTADIIGRLIGRPAGRDSLICECSPRSDRPDFTTGRSREEPGRCDEQLRRAWSRYMRPSPDRDVHEVLVCHGNVIRWFVTRALGADTRRWASMEIANASLTLIQVRSDGTTRLVMFDDVGHLPLGLQSWTGRGAGWERPARPLR